MNDKEIVGKISFSFTDENGETTSLQKTFTIISNSIWRYY